MLILLLEKVGLVWGSNQPDWKNLEKMENTQNGVEPSFLVELPKIEKPSKKKVLESSY